MATDQKKVIKKRIRPTSIYRNEKEYLDDYFEYLDFQCEMKECIKNEEEKTKINRLQGKVQGKWQLIQKKYRNTKKKNKKFAWEELAEIYQLSYWEQKIVLFLLYRYFNHEQGTTGRVILENVTNTRLEMMQARNLLMEKGKLRMNHILYTEEDMEEHNLLDSYFQMSDKMISRLLGEKQALTTSSTVEQPKTYESYLQLYFSFIQLSQEKAILQSILQEEDELKNSWDSILQKANSEEFQKIQTKIQDIEDQLAQYPDKDSYPLEQIVKEYQLSQDEKLILLILLKNSVVSIDPFAGCEGKKILSLLCDEQMDMLKKRSLLYKENKLLKNQLIETDDSNFYNVNILEYDYYLPENMIRRILGDAPSSLEKNKENLFTTIKPRFTFDDVILSPTKKQQIQITLSQQQNQELILKTWGFGEKIPYGNALTMLFTGKPGTGKTMMAEAIAHTLQKNLLIANYAQIQNKYVGETEKQIVNIFQKAKEQDDVLLWDEADSMFYSRDSATQSWESREINIILQQIEQFTGTVILTTNRTIALDKALERRIVLKINFEMPTAEEREKIWRSLIPIQAPFASDVDLQTLATQYEITGGLIKNALLHAARYTAYHKHPAITMQALLQGIQIQTENTWTTTHKIGFESAKLR